MRKQQFVGITDGEQLALRFRASDRRIFGSKVGDEIVTLTLISFVTSHFKAVNNGES